MKGEGGIARWEERKGPGVGDIDSVERMLLFVFGYEMVLLVDLVACVL